jgi:hypothetical protein
MTKTLLILMSVLLHITLWGQYTYFNSHLGPLGGVEAGSGTSTNLLVKNNQLISIVNYPNFGNISMSFNIQNMEGQWINQVVNQTNGQMLTNYGDSFSHYEGGIIGAGLFSQGPWPSIRWFNEDYNLIWEKQVPVFFDDNEEPVYYTSEINGQFHFAKPINDGGFMVAGPKTYNFGGNDFYHNLWLQRYDANHELVWDKEFPFYNENIIPQSKRFLRVNDLFELPNGDLLVWGCWYHAWMPMVLRFDSEGNFISSTSWGATGPTDTLNDWLPWPVQVDDEEFLFAYKHGTIFQNVIVQYGKPRIGHLDAATMQVTLFNPIERQAKHHWIMDFVTAADGGYVALGHGVNPDPNNPENNNFDIPFAYMVKVNATGEEIWYHQYVPPVGHIQPKAYDLEVTPDGGYAFVGNFQFVDQGNLTSEVRQWVVKTDACGELEYNGCEAVVTTNNTPTINHSPVSVWPNPTRDLLQINYPGIGVAQIVIRDARGVLVEQQAVSSQSSPYTMSLASQPAGLYLILLINQDGSVATTTRVVKE